MPAGTQGTPDVFISSRTIPEFPLQKQRVSYFTFDSFTKFARPITFAELSALGCVGGLNLVTSQALEFDEFLSLVERSHGAGEH